MRLAVLAASGPTGRQLTMQALESGHEVVALVRTPSKLDDLAHDRLEVVQADVLTGLGDAASGCDVLVSGLGVPRGAAGDPLVVGARAAVAAQVGRVVWLSALGTGATAGQAGKVYDVLVRRLLGAQLEGKAAADRTIITAGGTVVQPGILTDGPAKGAVSLRPAEGWRAAFPPRTSRADVARVMLAEALDPQHGGQVVVVA